MFPFRNGRSYDQDFWEQLWSRTLRERVGDVSRRPPNAHLTAKVGGLRRDLQAPGRDDGRKDVGVCRTPGRSDRLRCWS